MKCCSVTLIVAISLCFLSFIDPSFSYELTEPPPDSTYSPLGSVESESHLYGTEGDEFDISVAFPSFNGVFNLYVTNSVGLWDSTDVADFILAVMDDDSTNSDDYFPMLWNYFCYGDSNTNYAGVKYKIKRYPWQGPDTVFTEIDIHLYDRGDFGCPDCPYYVYKGYSWFEYGTNDFYLNGTSGDVDAIVSLGFAHEFQHLCYAANGWPYGYYKVYESLAVCAEYMTEKYDLFDKTWDVSYDASIYRGENCDPDLKYSVEGIWMGYLFMVFANGSGIEDDLIYDWIRYGTGSSYGAGEITMNSMAATLEDSDYSWLGGSTGDERLQNLFQYFSVAKFCNAPDFGDNNRFGYDGVYSPVTHKGLFTDRCDYYEASAKPQLPVDCPGNSDCGHNDPCGGCWNIRILPPAYNLGSESENSMTEVSGIYRDGDDTPADTTDGDKSRDYIDIATYGTDYIIFNASNYYQDDDCHELHFSLEGESSTPPMSSDDSKPSTQGRFKTGQ